MVAVFAIIPVFDKVEAASICQLKREVVLLHADDENF